MGMAERCGDPMPQVKDDRHMETPLRFAVTCDVRSVIRLADM